MTAAPTTPSGHRPRIDTEEVLDRDELNGTLDEVADRLWRRAVRSGTLGPGRHRLHRGQEALRRARPRRARLPRTVRGGVLPGRGDGRAGLRALGDVAPTYTQQAFLSSQLFEEYKHTDFFVLAFREVFGHEPAEALANPVHEPLPGRGDRLMEVIDTPGLEQDLARVEAVAHYQGVVEGVQANAGYQIFRRVFADKGLFPGLAEGYANIQREEGRHVGFGIAVLKRHAAADPRLAERIHDVFAEYLASILARYGQSIVVDGREVPPPPEERGPEQQIELCNRRMRDIFGPDAEPAALPGGAR